MLVTSYWIEEHVCRQQGCNEGGTIPWALNNCGDAKKLQCHKHLLQCSTFASERPQGWTRGVKLLVPGVI